MAAGDSELAARAEAKAERLVTLRSGNATAAEERRVRDEQERARAASWRFTPGEAGCGLVLIPFGASVVGGILDFGGCVLNSCSGGGSSPTRTGCGPPRFPSAWLPRSSSLPRRSPRTGERVASRRRSRTMTRLSSSRSSASPTRVPSRTACTRSPGECAPRRTTPTSRRRHRSSHASSASSTASSRRRGMSGGKRARRAPGCAKSPFATRNPSFLCKNLVRVSGIGGRGRAWAAALPSIPAGFPERASRVTKSGVGAFPRG